jgi:L-malate glycosyltransferase
MEENLGLSMQKASFTAQKILFVNHTGMVSGAERVLLSILDHLDRTRFEAIVSCPADCPLAQLIEERGIRVAALPLLQARFTWNPLLFVKYLRSYFQAIRKFRQSPELKSADILHANSVRAGLLTSFAAWGTGIPVIWHVHDTMKRHPISTVIRGVAWLLSPLSVIAVSRSTESRFRGLMLRFAKQRIPSVVVYNAVDTDRFCPSPAQRERTRSALQLRDEQFVFATIGQLTPRKGQLGTIRAFHRLSQRIAGVRLLIVGTAIFEHDHKYFELLKKEVDKLGLRENIFFLGHRSDVNGVLAASDAIVVNSRQEPFGLIALEGLAAGKPVVAASVDGIPELMKHEETGLLIPKGDEQALADAMHRLITDSELYEKLSSQGRIHVSTHFTCAGYTRQLERFYAQTSLRLEITSDLPKTSTSEAKPT